MPDPSLGGYYDDGEQRPIEMRILLAVLNELDYGVVVVDADGKVLHANRAAGAALQANHGTVLQDRDGQMVLVSKDRTLCAAIEGAAWRSLRALVTLDLPTGPLPVAVMPLRGAQDSLVGAALLLLGKPELCPGQSLQCFALAHGLTAAETRVLTALRNGDCPALIAERHRIAASTVSTQIKAIRAKTQASSIGALMRRLAALPPMTASC
jgi:DNA-binding CsgD family transcriptional regulator